VKPIRLHKYLADEGVDSRRKCEQYIREGLVRVNGRVVTEMGIVIDPKKDRISFYSRVIKARKRKYRTIMLNKPRGYVCTTSSKEGRSVYDLIRSIREKVVCIGRLDKKSEGLLLFSNDGELVYQLTHPSFAQEKKYHVMTSGTLNESVMKKLNSRLKIDGYLIQAAKVHIVRPGEKPGRSLLEFTLKEGRKHQIRKMCEAAGLTVHRLQRIQVKHIKLGGLKPGDWRDLSSAELYKLKNG